MKKISAQESLREAGLKVTEPRVALLEYLTGHHAPTSIQELSEVRKLKGINRVTLYRILKLFKQHKLVRQISLQRDEAYFEAADPHDHHHIVCMKCGAIEDFTGCTVEALMAPVLKKSKKFGTILDHSLEVFGVCVNCEKK